MVESFITSKNYLFYNEIQQLMLVNNVCQENITFFYSNIVIDKEQAKDICIRTINQTGPYWHKVRQFRITGTSAYNLVTYCKGKKMIGITM